MATILPFKRAGAHVVSRLPVPAGGARIVIFPGVRYERRDGDDGGKDAPGGLRQHRKRRTRR